MDKELVRNQLVGYWIATLDLRPDEVAAAKDIATNYVERIAQAAEEEIELKNIALKELDIALERLAALHEQEMAQLKAELESVDAALDAAKYPRRHHGINDYPRYLDRVSRIGEVMQYLQNEGEYWQGTYDRCGELEAKIADLQTQMVMMAEALNRLCRAVWYGTDDDRQSAYDQAQIALSAAPHVLDHIKAKRTTNISGDTLLAFPWHENGVRVVQVYDAALEQYGDDWVEVFVCSVKAGCQPGSEQEE